MDVKELKENKKIVEEGIEENEETKSNQKEVYWAEIDRIQEKLKANQELSPSENVFVQQHNADVLAAQEEQKKLVEEEARKKYLAGQVKLKKEFDDASEDTKLSAKESGKFISPSKLSFFLKNMRNKKIMTKAHKKGGTVILKGYKSKGLEVIYSKKPVAFVEFKAKNERGEDVTNYTRVNKVRHYVGSTSIPLHVCLEGIAENVDLFEGIEGNLSAEWLNKWGSGMFQAGLITNSTIGQVGSDKNFDKYIPLIFLAVFAVLIYVAYQQSQIWNILIKLTGSG